jgi:type I restriction enzyme S subunit
MLRTSDVDSFLIPLPPLAEQKRIVSKIEELFSELDAGEESLRRARRQLGVYRQSLLKQAFEGKLTEQWRKQNPHLLESPEQLLTRIQTERQAEYAKQLREWEKAKQTHKRASKPSEPKLMDGLAAKEIARIDPPDGWATEKIGNCPTDSLIGLVRAATEQSSDPTGVSYIKMDRVDMLGNVDLSADVFVACTEEEIERFQLRQGDILFNTRNSVELVGKTAVVRRDPTVPTVYNNNLMRIRLPDSLDPTFVGLQMCAKPFRQRMEQVKKATTSVAAIYGKDFWPLGITFPSLPEQCEIVRLLDEQFTVIEQNEREIDAALKRSAALRQSILKKAFTGQLVPQDPTDEPASALLERIRKERDTGSVSKKKTALKKAKPI